MKEHTIQQIPTTRLAKEFGTPLYVYDAETIVSQYDRLAQAFSETNTKIKYAAKALTNLSVLKLLKNCGAGIDAVSSNEVLLAKKAGFAAKDIIFTPNCVSFEEIQQGVAQEVIINIDNLPFLELFGKTYKDTYPVCLRINPHIQAGGNTNIQVGNIDSKFGISYWQFSEAKKIIDKHNILVNGIHVHTGSDILEADVFLRVADIIYDIATQFSNLEFIDFGSGFKVAYKQGDVSTDVEALGKKFSASFNAFCKRYGKDLELWFEPGKYLVSQAGYFLTTVNVVKPTPACVFVGLNSGFNHFIRPMFYDAHHEILNLTNFAGEPHVYNIVGYICETDTFAHERTLPEVRTGDVLAFKNAGAYSFEMSSRFNSRLRPAEVLVYKGRAHLVREKEVFEDLLAHQKEIDLE